MCHQWDNVLRFLLYPQTSYKQVILWLLSCYSSMKARFVEYALEQVWKTPTHMLITLHLVLLTSHTHVWTFSRLLFNYSNSYSQFHRLWVRISHKDAPTKEAIFWHAVFTQSHLNRNVIVHSKMRKIRLFIRNIFTVSLSFSHRSIECAICGQKCLLHVWCSHAFTSHYKAQVTYNCYWHNTFCVFILNLECSTFHYACFIIYMDITFNYSPLCLINTYICSKLFFATALTKNSRLKYRKKYHTSNVHNCSQSYFKDHTVAPPCSVKMDPSSS